MNNNTRNNLSSSKKVGGVNKNINNNIKFFKSNRNFNTKRLIVFLYNDNKRKIVIKNNKKKNINNNNNKYNIMKYNNNSNNINNNSNSNGNNNNSNIVVIQNNTNYGSPVVGSLLNSVTLSAAALVPETCSISNYDDMIDYNSVPSENVLNAPTNYTSYLIGLYNTNEQLCSYSAKDTIDADLNNYGSMFELINGNNNNNNNNSNNYGSPLIRSSSQTVPTL